MVRVIRFREDFRFFTARSHDLTVLTRCRHLAWSPYRDCVPLVPLLNVCVCVCVALTLFLVIIIIVVRGGYRPTWVHGKKLSWWFQKERFFLFVYGFVSKKSLNKIRFKVRTNNLYSAIVFNPIPKLTSSRQIN